LTQELLCQLASDEEFFYSENIFNNGSSIFYSEKRGPFEEVLPQNSKEKEECIIRTLFKRIFEFCKIKTEI